VRFTHAGFFPSETGAAEAQLRALLAEPAAGNPQVSVVAPAGTLQ